MPAPAPASSPTRSDKRGSPPRAAKRIGPPRADKRGAILDAALALFCEHTFDGTAVPLVAERAHVGAGTIYRYFDSKEALGNAVYQRCKGEMKRVLVDEAPPGLAPREAFAHFWRALWRFAGENPQAFNFLETHHHAPYLDAASLAVGDDITDGIRDFVRGAQRAGAIRKIDAAVLIAMVFGAFTGLVKTGACGVNASPKFIAETEACMWEMVRA